MTITLERDALHEALKLCAICADNKLSIPVLSHIRLRTRDGGIEFNSHNLDQSASASLRAESKANGSLCVPARRFLDIVSGLQKGAHIELAFDKAKLGLKSGRSRYSLPCLPADDLPEALEAGGVSFTMPGNDLCALLSTVRGACEQIKTVSYSEGIFLQAGDRLSAVATNHHRIHVAWAALENINLPPNGEKGRAGAILSSRAVGDLMKFCAGQEISVTCSPSIFEVKRQDGSSYATKLIDAQFPHFERIMPGPQDNRVVVSRSELSGACDRLLAACDQNETAGVLAWGDSLSLKIDNKRGEEAEGHETIDGEAHGEADIKLRLQYLADAIAMFSCDQIEIHCAGTKQPVMLRGESPCLAVVSQVVV